MTPKERSAWIHSQINLEIKEAADKAIELELNKNKTIMWHRHWTWN